jgi:hypothetical protein
MAFATRLFLVILTLSSLAALSGAYVTQIHASAVLEGEKQGLLTVISLNVTPGNGTVKFGGQTQINASTISSAKAAVQYASSYLAINSMRYNFVYTILNATGDVSGPSGGLAFTLLAISGLEKKQLAQDFSVTGTIQSGGTVGLIGGAYNKVGAARQGGMSFMLVPATQGPSFEALLYYLTQQSFGIPVVEVGNVSQAIPYAFGSAPPTPMTVNFTQTYNLGIPSSNVTCAGCNASAFGTLVNSTLNFTGSYIMNLSGNFSAAKSQLLGNLNEYKALQGKGYAYTAADFAFLDFAKEFTLYNAQNLNESDAWNIESNVSTYCSSLTPPPLTDSNYEYVLGGNLRHYWANITLNESEQLLNSSQTTDDVMQSIYQSAEALGWCRATGIQYQIASSLGGNYVMVSPSTKAYVSSQINGQTGLASDLYSQSMRQAYAAGQYATALYAEEYENAFGSKPFPNLNNSQLISAISGNIRNASSGTWPSQFAAQAEFYLNEAKASKNASAATNYLHQAYSTSVLASGLAAANARLSGSFIPSSGATVSTAAMQELSDLQQSVNELQQELSDVYFVLLVVVVLLFALLVALLMMLLKPKGVTRKPRAKRRRARR